MGIKVFCDQCGREFDKSDAGQVAIGFDDDPVTIQIFSLPLKEEAIAILFDKNRKILCLSPCVDAFFRPV